MSGLSRKSLVRLALFAGLSMPLGVATAEASSFTFSNDDRIHNWDFGGSFGSPNTYRFVLAFDPDTIFKSFDVGVTSEPFSGPNVVLPPPPIPAGSKCIPFVTPAGADNGCRWFDVNTGASAENFTDADGHNKFNGYHVLIEWTNNTGTTGVVNVLHLTDGSTEPKKDTDVGSFFQDVTTPPAPIAQTFFPASEPLDPASPDQFKNPFYYFLYLFFFDLNKFFGIPIPSLPDPGVSGTEDLLEFSPIYAVETTVPEPATLALLGSGLAVAWMARRRAARNAS